jgi:sphingomyelin phosphodiesterase 2
MTIIRDYADLNDCWSTTHHAMTASTRTATSLTPENAISRFGVTADSPLNTYTSGKHLDDHARQYMGKRLDYIFYRQPTSLLHSSDQERPILDCKECKVVLTEHVPGYDFSFSDHFGLEATLEFPVIGNDDEWATTSGFGLSTRQWRKPSSIPIGSLDVTIQALSDCYRHSRYRSRKELAIFGICLFFLVVIIPGSVWLPYLWLNPVVILLTIGVSWIATTLLYEGFIYGQWERNALTNATEDLEIYKRVLEGRSDT